MTNPRHWTKGRRLAGLLVLLGTMLPGKAAEWRPDLEYARLGEAVLKLDALVPEGDGPFPMVLLIHGGGWSSGDRRGDVTIFTNVLTAGGFTWFSMDYRLAPNHRWPACIEDVQTAIRWVKSRAAEFKGDPDRLALIGYSAGGHLACLAAVQADDATRVQAVVGCAAPTDHVADSERRGGLSPSLQGLLDRPVELDPATRHTLREISPINYVKPGLPPFLLIQGTADTSVPYAQATQFLARLQRAGVPAELITLTNAPHRVREWEKSDAEYQARMIKWLRRVLTGSVEGSL